MGAEPGVLGSSGTSIVEWPGSSAAVILEIGDALLVAGPSKAIELLRSCPREQLVDVDGTASALGILRPVLVGKALLGYVDRSNFTPAGAPPRAHRADRGAMEEVIAQCEADDRDESGLLEMPLWFVAEDAGVPVAAAGYEDWSGAVAHCGVAVGARHRDKGWGRAVAQAAVGHALDKHDVVQWRSRDTNLASTRLGERLGFARAGTQTAFDLRP